MAEPHEIDDAEAARLRDEVIKRMLATPPQPHGKKMESDSVQAGKKRAATKDGPKSG